MFGLANCPQEISCHGGRRRIAGFGVCRRSRDRAKLRCSKKGTRKDGISGCPSISLGARYIGSRVSGNQKPLAKRGFHEKPFFAMALVSNRCLWPRAMYDAWATTRKFRSRRDEKRNLSRKASVRLWARIRVEERAELDHAGADYLHATGGGATRNFGRCLTWLRLWLAGMVAQLINSRRIEKCLFVDVFMAITRWKACSRETSWN